MGLQLDYLVGVSHSFQTIFLASLIAGVVALLPKLLYKIRLSQLPVLEYGEGGKKRDIYLKSATELYAEGYQRVKSTQPC